MRETFRKAATRVATLVGSYWAFTLAVLAVLVWGATGPYSTIQILGLFVINTGTTIVTFLMYSSSRTPRTETPALRTRTSSRH